jgi:hypothetical protein
MINAEPPVWTVKPLVERAGQVELELHGRQVHRFECRSGDRTHDFRIDGADVLRNTRRSVFVEFLSPELEQESRYPKGFQVDDGGVPARLAVTVGENLWGRMKSLRLEIDGEAVYEFTA